MSDLSSSRDNDELVKELANDLIDYYVDQVQCDVTIEGLQETMEKYPVEIIEEAIVMSKIFPIFLSSEHVTLDLVTHLMDLAPTVVSTVETEDDEEIISQLWNPDHWLSGSSKTGSLPLHIACKNRECPESVIKFLLEKYPSAAEDSWTDGRGKSYGFPLHCYLTRAIETCEAYDYYDESLGEVISDHSEIPGQQLDCDTVEMLVQACPEALTTKAKHFGTPLNILCRGCSVSLELAQLLTDEEQKCFEVDDSNIQFPLRCLLENVDFDSDFFPTDVFRYLMECSPSSLRRQQPVEYDKTRDCQMALFTDTLLHVACSNPEISAEVIQIIVDECPYMVKEEYAENGFLPLHSLCCNEDLDDEVSMDILKILVNEFPESVRSNVGVAHGLPDWLSVERGENDLPIHYACRYKSLDFCRYLIEKHPESVLIRQLHYYSDEVKILEQGSLMLPFHLACKYGSLDLVQYLLEQYPDALELQTSDRNYKFDYKKGRFNHVEFNESNASLLQEGNYPLHLAASREESPEKMEIVNFLLQQDNNAVSKVGKYGNLPLHRACWHSHLNIVEKLFQLYPAAIDTKNIFGQLPIHPAMQYSDESTFDGLSFLSHKQPDALSILDERGMSCAHYACSSKNALKKLDLIAELSPEAFRCQSDSCGLPIHYACSNACDKEVLRYLVAQYPESLGVHVGSLGSPLHCFLEDEESRFEQYHSSKKYHLFLFLFQEKYRSDVESGLPIAHAFLQDDEMQDKDRILAFHPFSPVERAEEDEKGRTLAHLIFRITKDVDLIVRNLRKTGTLSKQDHDGWLPLHHAIRQNASLQTIRELLGGYPESAQVTDNEGRTPLHIACRYGNTSLIEALMEIDLELLQGDMLSKQDHNGWLPLHHVMRNDASPETVRFLLDLDRHPEHAQVTDNEGRTPLHIACHWSKMTKIEALVEANPELVQDEILSKQDQNGWLPLHHAMSNNAPPKTVRFLLDEHQEHVQVTDNEGRTPLHIACQSSEKSVMKVLLEVDPELVRITDNHGRTALHYACRFGRSRKIIAFLLERNSDITAADRKGDLPLHKACQRGHVRVIKYLMTKDMTSVYARNNLNELPVHVLSNRSGKKNEVLESTEYTEAILKLLLAYPETVDL